MYLDYFGLRQSPFRITPHTAFFFTGADRGAMLEALIYAITHDEGIVKVSGEVGSGKTMLCRMLLEKLPEQVETVYLANPMLSPDEILFAIAADLQIPLPEGSRHLLLRSLQDRLLEIYAAGRQVVVLIDEAHAMQPAALEEIRLLSNLESSCHKLLQLVLFGQPELDQRLRDAAMRQLNERITHHFRLLPLRRNDIAVYLMFRLRAAGYHGPEPFTRGAIRLISKVSEGLTRRINILADKALLAAYCEGAHQIGGRQVRAAMRDAQFARIDRRLPGGWRWAAATAIVCAIAALAYLAGDYPGATAPAAESRSGRAGEMPSPDSPTSVMPGPAPVPTARLTLGTEPRGPLWERIAATREWLKNTPDTHYFIQILVTDGGGQREVADFIARNAGTLDPSQIRVYRKQHGGGDRLGIIYGDYASRDEANAALATLGDLSPAGRPYVRAVAKLRSSRPPA